jgi:hypothetical protein
MLIRTKGNDMTHYHEIEDEQGDLSTLIPFCSDSCHRDWHLRQTDASTAEYEGWNGCHDDADCSEYCANCGVIAHAGDDACEHQRDNIVVNRFVTEDGEMCPDGNWIQLPRSYIDPD